MAGLVARSVGRVPSLSAPQRPLRVGQPLWLADAARGQQRYPALSGRHDAAVAVVGGGITGALVAHAFATAGISTTVLEAAAVGRGSTAASSALLLKEPDLELTQLTNRYGVRRSRRIWELSHQSVDQLIALLKRRRIRCDLKMRDAVYYATTAQAAERLRQEHELRARLGFESEWLGPVRLRRLTGITGHGAVLTKASAQFDPYRACVGILRAASAAGAHVFERSEVRRIEKHLMVCASAPVTGRSTRTAWSSRPVTRRPGFVRWRDVFACIGRMFLRPSRSTLASVTTSVCPTSWSGTPSGRITMLAGHRIIDFSWAAGTVW